MPNICFINLTDKKSITYKEELARDLQREGITIGSSLTNCQVMILLQTIETTRSPRIKTLLTSAQQLIQQQQREESTRSAYESFLQANEITQSPHIKTLLTSSQKLTQRRPIQSIVRFVYEDVKPLPEGWDTLTAIDATGNRAAATKQLARFILHTANTTTPSIQITHPFDNRTNSLGLTPPSSPDNQSMKSLLYISEQLNIPITSALKLATLNKFFEEGSKLPVRSLEHSKPEQRELDNPVESPESTQASLLTQEKSASEDLANTFEDNEAPATVVKPSIVQVQNEPDTQPPPAQTEVQVESEPDTQTPLAQKEKKASQPSSSVAERHVFAETGSTTGNLKGPTTHTQPPLAPTSPRQHGLQKDDGHSSAVQSPSPTQPQISKSQQSARASKAYASPGSRPSSPLLPVPRLPKLSQPVRLKLFAPPSRLQRWWPLAAISAVLFIALLVTPVLLAHTPSLFAQKPRHAALPAPQLAGYAYLFSSNIINANNTTGINDGLQINLTHITPPASGTQYYGWLLPDLNQHRSMPIYLGVMPVQGGTIKVRFINPTHTDLLARTSQFLITQESATSTPAAPSSNHTTWRYYAQLPQQPGTASMGTMTHLSFLDHLRHLLVEDPEMANLGAHGGISLWTKDNIRKVLEWSNAARGTGVPQGPDVMHRQFIRILDYLDGATYVKQDLPAKSPFLVDQVGGHFGLLTIRPNADPPGYLQEMAMHLEEMVSSPGTTSSERALAEQIDAALTQVQANLDQARQDAIKLVNTPEGQLQSAASTNLLDDLVEQVNNSYTGLYDPQTGARTQGITWVCDQLQHLATYEVKPYTPGQSSMPIPTKQQATPTSKMKM